MQKCKHTLNLSINPIVRYLLPPATKLEQGNIFSSVCQEFCPWGGYLGPPGQVHPHWTGTPPWASIPPQAGTPPGQVLPPGRYTHTHPPWSMSGRYASYWNAFLFSIVCRSTPCPNVKHGDDWGDPTQCEQGDNCPYCHTRTEQQFHPEVGQDIC